MKILHGSGCKESDNRWIDVLMESFREGCFHGIGSSSKWERTYFDYACPSSQTETAFLGSCGIKL